MKSARGIVFPTLLLFMLGASIPCRAELVDESYNARPSYAQGKVDLSKYPSGFPQFWERFQSAVLRGSIEETAELTIFPMGSICNRSKVQLKEFILRFHRQLESVLLVKDPRDSRLSDYVEMTMFNLIVSADLSHPEFHFYSDSRVTLNRLEFRHVLSKWYWACW